jgi:inosine/xanthosine triphosphatase
VIDVRQVAVGSSNRAKVRAVRSVASRVWPEASLHPVEVPSGVAAMPLSDDEARRGALTRARASRHATDADLGVGLEGSACEVERHLYLTGWVAVVDRYGRESLASGPRLPLPEIMVRALRAGEELAPIIDHHAGEEDTRHRGGAMGYLTRGLLERDHSFEVALACALAPWLRQDTYGEDGQDQT